VIALDSNILVYARRMETPHHPQAARLLAELAEGDNPWAIPWPCVYEFLRVVTHPRVFNPPSDPETTLNELQSLFESKSLTMLGEGSSHAAHLRLAILGGRAAGNLVHDAHIAALAVEHGVTELWTTDRDFARFPGLRIRNPFDEATLAERATPYGMGRRSPRKRVRGGARRGRATGA
jgi:hypothetical protein